MNSNKNFPEEDQTEIKMQTKFHFPNYSFTSSFRIQDIYIHKTLTRLPNLGTSYSWTSRCHENYQTIASADFNIIVI